MIDLNEMQRIIMSNKEAKGFNTTNVETEILLAYGELAEVYDAWRAHKLDLGEEIADVAIYLLGISEMIGIDLEYEIRKKVDKNLHRKCEISNGVPIRIED